MLTLRRLRRRLSHCRRQTSVGCRRVLELLQLDVSADVRRRLAKAGEDAGVDVRMSRVGGPAL